MFLDIRHKKENEKGCTVFLVRNGMYTVHYPLYWEMQDGSLFALKHDFDFLKSELKDYLEKTIIQEDDFYLDIDKLYDVMGLDKEERKKEIEHMKEDERQEMIEYLNNYTMEKLFEEIFREFDDNDLENPF